MHILMLATLVYVMWLPVSLPQVLYPVLALGAFSAMWRIGTRNLRVTPGWAGVAAALASAVMVGVVIGTVRNNPGLSNQTTLWVGAPVIWGLWAAALTQDLISTALRTVVLASGISSLLIIVYVAQNQGLLPAIIPEAVLVMQGSGYDLTDSGSAIRWLGLSTLVISGPLSVAAFIMGPRRYLPTRTVTGVASVLALVAALVAGRRALVLVMLLAPALTWLIRRWLEPDRRRLIVHPGLVMALPILFVAAVAVWDSGPTQRVRGVLLDTASTYFGLGPGSGSAKSLDDVARTSQSNELLAGWSERPVFGNGLGAVIPGYARNVERPWTFELQYHMLGFNLGLVGAVLTVVATVLAFREVRRAAAFAPDAAPALAVVTVGAAALLLANASNPYLQAVGHWWGLALWAGVSLAVRRGAPPSQPSLQSPSNGESWKGPRQSRPKRSRV